MGTFSKIESIITFRLDYFRQYIIIFASKANLVIGRVSEMSREPREREGRGGGGGNES